MALDIKPGFWYVGIWYFDFPNHGNGPGNWNLCAWCAGEKKPTKPVIWTIRYRFRYFRSAKIFDSGDEFKWYDMESAPMQLKTLQADLTMLATKLCAAMKGFRYEFWPMGGNNEHCIALLRKCPPSWMHMDPRQAFTA